MASDRLGLITRLFRNFSIRPICSVGMRSAVLTLGARCCVARSPASGVIVPPLEPDRRMRVFFIIYLHPFRTGRGALPEADRKRVDSVAGDFLPVARSASGSTALS